MVHQCVLGNHNLTSQNNNSGWIWLWLLSKVRGPILMPQSLWPIQQKCLKTKKKPGVLLACLLLHSRTYCAKSCRIIAVPINSYGCQLAEHIANSTLSNKPIRLAQSRKEKVIFPLWNRIQGRGCRGLVTAEQHTANSRHNSRPHLPSLISQTACLHG